jgi:ATP-binding cassette subfamily B (MDR/TAP) protein 1
MWFVLAVEVFVAFGVLGIVFGLMAAYNSFFYSGKYFDAMLNQDFPFFSQGSNSAGVLTARLSSHTTQLQGLVSSTLGLLLVIVVDLISYVIFQITLAPFVHTPRASLSSPDVP